MVKGMKERDREACTVQSMIADADKHNSGILVNIISLKGVWFRISGFIIKKIISVLGLFLKRNVY